MHCGMHALNNALGRATFTRDLMKRACDAVVRDTGEARGNHMAANGWYSEVLLARALLDNTAFRWCMTPLHVHAELLQMPPALVPGAVVNMSQTHWIALRWDEARQCVWLLNSTSSSPQCLWWPEYVVFINEHVAAFALKHVSLD